MIKLIGPKYIALLTVIASVSVIGTGFSSWTITQPSFASIYIDVQVADVISNNAFNISNVETFSLGPDGLVEDFTIVDTSTIKAQFTINNSVAYKLSNSGNLSFSIALGCSNSTFLSTYIGTTPSVTSVSGSSSITSSGLTEDRIVTSLTCTISDTGTTSITATYTVTDDGTIKSYSSDKPTFSFKVGMSV